jgi:glutamyl-tRNA synthetase
VTPASTPSARQSRPSPLPERAASAAPGVTRLAPSPTGVLHLGNARTFLVNWALARKRGWRIIYRLEDLDGPRVKPEAAKTLKSMLGWIGIDWDEEAPAQSTDLGPCEEAIRRLAAAGRAYPCELTRSEIDQAASAPHAGEEPPAYPPHLRPTRPPGAFTDAGTNWRFIAPDQTLSFTDRFAGHYSENVARTVGDFVIWTRRSQPSYQLAVSVDDHRQGVTEVVRGDDLLPSTARQILLRRALAMTPDPAYTHIPLVLGPDGRRLAKRHGDTRLERYRTGESVPAERVVGLLASWSGVVETPEPMTASEFADAFSLDTMPSEPATFTTENERWLLGDTP